jgi:hypothetical protein
MRISCNRSLIFLAAWLEDYQALLDRSEPIPVLGAERRPALQEHLSSCDSCRETWLWCIIGESVERGKIPILWPM